MEQNRDIEAQLRAIRTQLRLSMNGVVSSDMRQRGLSYRMNFGVTFPLLKGIAAQYTPSAALSEALWRQEVRECKLLAVLLYPVEEYTESLAKRWIAQVSTAEVCQYLASCLLVKTPFALSLVFDLLENQADLIQYLGTQLAAALFREHRAFSSEELARFVSLVQPLVGREPLLRRGALSALGKAMEADAQTAKTILHILGMGGSSADPSAPALRKELYEIGLCSGTLFE